jgi:hypothetical protein
MYKPCRDPNWSAPCHHCRKIVSRRDHRDCVRCTWVKCPDCGSCGCDHPDYAAWYAAGARKVTR